MTIDNTVDLVERYNLPNLPTLAELPTEDGIPLETNWHRIQINLLIDIITQRWRHVQNFLPAAICLFTIACNKCVTEIIRGRTFSW